MKITIETKFDIGDTVYIADSYDEFYPHKQPYVVMDVLTNTNHGKTHIRYQVEIDGMIDFFPEEWVFLSYEECAQWCKEHN